MSNIKAIFHFPTGSSSSQIHLLVLFCHYYYYWTPQSTSLHILLTSKTKPPFFFLAASWSASQRAALLGDPLLLLEMLIIFGCLMNLLHICRKDIRRHYKHVFQFLLSVGAKSFKEAFTNSRRLNWTKGTLLHLILVRFRLQTTHNWISCRKPRFAAPLSIFHN